MTGLHKEGKLAIEGFVDKLISPEQRLSREEN
jgi:hypothetical protein